MADKTGSSRATERGHSQLPPVVRSSHDLLTRCLSLGGVTGYRAFGCSTDHVPFQHGLHPARSEQV